MGDFFFVLFKQFINILKAFDIKVVLYFLDKLYKSYKKDKKENSFMFLKANFPIFRQVLFFIIFISKVNL